MGVGVAVASVALGTTVIEKHFTLDRTEGGVDSAFSLESVEISSLVKETMHAWQALGSIRYGTTEAEHKSKAFRRSLYACEDIAEDEQLTASNIRAIRPGFALTLKYLEQVLGKRVKHAVKCGTPISWNLF